MSQDAYGSVLNVSRGDHLFPIPDLPVGRLVERASEVTAQLQSFSGTLQVTRRPLAVGYDFMADGAREFRDEIDLATGLTSQRNVTVSTNGTPTTYGLIYEGTGDKWTADALRAAWLDERHDITFLGAHFSDAAALAADGTTILRSEDLDNASADLTNTLILGQGCHLGYNLVDPDGVPVVTQTLDWAQAAGRRKVGALIAGTGYQFGAGPSTGDTGDILEYGERLYLNIAKQLRSGAPGSVTIGKAFIEGKRDYLAVVGSYLGGLHEKQLAEATLFGFPMLAVNLAGAAPTAGTVQPVTPDVNGDVSISFSGLRALQNHGGFYSGPFGTLGVPGLPVLPVDLADASSTQVLRGVGFREGTYTDTTPFRPTISSPATEATASLTPAYRSPVFAPTPVQLGTVNYLGALARGTTYLVLTPAEYESASAASETGTLRTFSNLKLRLFYRTPAASSLAQPPAFVDVRATPDGNGNALFEAFVVGDQTVSIDQVWVTYTNTRSPFPRMWRSVDLARDLSQPGYWKATKTLADLGVESFDDVVFLAQAASGAGSVGFATNGGAYYRIAAPTATVQTPKLATDIAITAAPTSGAYRSKQTFTAHLREHILGAVQPLAGKNVRFTLGSQRLGAVTDANGDATISLILMQSPGPYRIRAAFDEDATDLASAASAALTITKAPSTLTLGTLNVIAGGRWSGIATLSIGSGAPTESQTVFFVASSGAGNFVTSTITGTDGRATIPAWALPVGSYSLTAYFAKPVLAGTTLLYDATSQYYAGSQATGTLTVSAARVVYTGDTTVFSGANINLRALVTAPAGQSAANAKVRYVVKRADGTTASSTAPVSIGAGDWLATITGGLPIGVYTVHTYIAGTTYDGEGPVATLAVKFNLCLLYDPTKAVLRGSTAPIKFQLCSATGGDLSAPGIVVHAVNVVKISPSISGQLEDSGSANPDSDFRYDPTLGTTGGYIYNLSTKGLTTGTWKLTFTVQDKAGSTSTQTYATNFQGK